MYSDLIMQEEWKEVFVFSSGMHKNIKEQDEFLDFVMEKNLKLYIECINAKSDLSSQLSYNNKEEFIERYLSQIIRSYTFIINNYFKSIKHCFDPKPGRFEKRISEKKLKIIGTISDDGESLIYWFDRVISNQEDILCFGEGEISKHKEDLKKQALIEGRHIRYYSINLRLSGLMGDSARKIVIDLIKRELDSILKNRTLIESNYLLTERLYSIKKDMKEIKELSNVKQMYRVINKLVIEATDKVENLEDYEHYGVDMFYLKSLLKDINDRNINYEECLLPLEDMVRNKVGSWTWDLYSNLQKENRIAKFFYFHKLSYLKMVEDNFPTLGKYFSRYLDSPYQNIIYIESKDKVEKKGTYPGPYITYYYIASKDNSFIQPEIRHIDNQMKIEDFTKDIFNEIRESYLIKGKEANKIEYTQNRFTFTTRSINTGKDIPLSKYVYDAIKRSLEEIFGRL